MVIASAFLGELPGHAEHREVLGAALDADERAQILQAIAHRGIDFVAKEAVKLSTMPVWRNGRLEPRPFTLRLFLARVSDGWRVMPGGFVRIADDADARAVSLQRGGSTGRRLGAVRQAGDRDHAAAGAGPDHDHARHRRAAEPRRRQPVLGRALRGACRGDACAWCARSSAASPTATRPPRRSSNASPRCSAPGKRCRPSCRTSSRRWSRRAALQRRGSAGRSAAPRRRSPVGRVGDPRPVFPRRLAGADRSVRADPYARSIRRRPRPRSWIGSTARCASSRRSPAWRRRT